MSATDPISYYAHQQITEEDIAAVVSVLRSDYLTQGPKVAEFEEALAAYVGARYAVAVSNGTTALYLACWAALGDKTHCQECGYGRMGHVVTSPLSFLATANAAQLCGAMVGFEDVDPLTGNIACYTRDADLLVPVHLAGRACQMPTHDGSGLSPMVIEDACHALGAMDFDNCSRVGSCAHSLATCFSFHPVKPITTGEGGAVMTNDGSFAKEIRNLRDHGREDGLMMRLGTNARMTDIQAALGISQLKRCDEMLSARGHWAWTYINELCHMPDLMIPQPPRDALDFVLFDKSTSWHLYPVRIKNGRRDEIKAKLNDQGIGAQVHYSPIIPLHPYYQSRYRYRPGQFPHAEAWAAEALSLPLHAGMNDEDVGRVVSALRKALREE